MAFQKQMSHINVQSSADHLRYSSLTSILRQGHLHPVPYTRLNWLMGFMESPVSAAHFTTEALILQMSARLYVGSGDWYSSPRACETSELPSGPFP